MAHELGFAHTASETSLDQGFRLIADHLNQVFWIYAADFSEVVHVSKAYESIWGRPCESLRRDPRSWMAAVHPDDRPTVLQTIVNARDAAFDLEYRIVRPDGSTRWIRDRGCPVRDETGRVYRFAGIAEDISERKCVDEQLKTSERLLAEAQRLAHIGSWHWDVKDGVVTWSDELYRIFGVWPGAINPGLDAMAFIFPEDRETVYRTIEEATAAQGPYCIFYRIRRPDGDVRFLQSRGCVVCDEQGRRISMFGATQDMTDLRRTEGALRRSEELFRLVLEAIPVGVTVMDPDGQIILSNPASKAIWGEVISSPTERYAKSAGWWHATGTRIKPDEWASVRARVNGETSLNEMIDIETFDARKKVIQNSAIPVRDEGQSILGAVVINEDVTERLAAELHLKESARQMKRLANRLMQAQDDERRRIARMLHETTAQDLAAMKMLLAHLSRSAGRSEIDHDLIGESLELVERTIRDVRTLSALLHPPLLDETGLLPALRWYAQGFAERSGIQVGLDLPDAFGRLPREVETTLFRVVQEALINIHRHAESATADVSLRVVDNSLALTVRDRGRGIPADLVSRLMGAGGELGVGVVGMRERLRQLNGTVEIESDGHGTVVRAVVPYPAGAQ